MASGYNIIERVRRHILKFLIAVEDIAYGGIGILLSGVAFILLAVNLKLFGLAVLKAAAMGAGGGGGGVLVIELLDGILLVMLVIELLYTVQVAYREHTLAAEPFVVIALISAIRRILVLTAEVSKIPEADEIAFRRAIGELGLLTVMVLVLVASLVALQRHAKRMAE